MMTEACPHLENHGIYIEDLKTERVVNTDFLRLSKNYLEISKLIKNSIQLLKRDVPGNSNLVTQMCSKIDYFRNEANETKKRLREIHSVEF